MTGETGQSKCTWKPVKGAGVWLIVTIVGLVVASLFTPFGDHITEWSRRQICPMPMVCPIEQTFKASADVQCQDGDIGRLIRRSQSLRPPESREEDLALRTYLCASADWAKSSPEEHLARLARDFSSCFILQEPDGAGAGRSQARFMIRIEVPNVCATGLEKPDGVWKSSRHDDPGRLLCLPSATPLGPPAVSGKPRACSDPELAAVGFPPVALKLRTQWRSNWR
jgi:hypothetical protein